MVVLRSFFGLLRLFLWNSKLRIEKNMQYRTDFFLGLFINTAFSSIGPIFQYLLFTQTRGYPGWNLEQIILFQGILLIWTGLRDLLFIEIRNIIQDLIRKGDFDRLLLKPYPPIGIILVSGFNMNSIGTIITGIIISIYSINKIGIAISLIQIFQILICLVCGIILSMAVLTLYSSIVIMIIQIGRISEILDSLLRFSEFPLEIFSKAARLVLIIIFPLIIWIYLPTQILLQRANMILFISCLSCLLFMIISIKIWNICLKRYKSAGG